MTKRVYDDLALYVAGEWITKSGSSQEVVNPATGEVIGVLPHADRTITDRALDAAATSFRSWSRSLPSDRAAILRRAANIIRRDLEHSAELMTLEQGKPLAESRSEYNTCAMLLEWGADAAMQEAGRILPDRDGPRRLAVRKEPIGPVVALSPWNFPASIATRKVATALAVGCTVVAKPAEETPASFLPVARALDEAGLPAGVLNVVYGDPAAVTEQLIDSDVTRKVSFTGSTRVGKLVAARAGAHAKPAVLELGGHAPVLVFNDADLEKTIALSVTTKVRNAGQVCIAPTRFFVQDSAFDAFSEGIVHGMENVVVGDGLEAGSIMGPLINERRIEAVDRLVEDALRHGAKLLTGGCRSNKPGYFYAPTVLADVPPEAQIMTEEPFGPIAILNRFKEFDEAIASANGNEYALGAYAFTKSDETAERVASEINAGMVGLNTYSVVFMDSPIGGRKMSGYGSEGGPEGLEAYRMNKFVSLF
jgi:succinate-semialdehyde dehydrogenase/glutarate-semialdehyde dehydrogenase